MSSKSSKLKEVIPPEILLKAKFKLWTSDFELGLRECFGMELTNQQREFVRILNRMFIAKYKRNTGAPMDDLEVELASKVGISIHSGRGLGKDYVVAGLIPLILLLLFPFKGVLLANTQAQLEDVLSSEVRARLRNAPVDMGSLIEVNKNRIYLRGSKRGDEGEFFAKRTVSVRADSDTAEASLGGYHDDYMLVVYDEASGMPNAIAKPIIDTMTGLSNVAVLLGNCTRYSGYFWQTHYDVDVSKQWYQVRWSGEESDLNEIKPGLSSYIESQLKYGRDSAAYRINVLGLPPVAERDSLIPIDWIWDAVEADIEPSDTLCVGVDPARTGDATAIVYRSGAYVYDDILEQVSNDTTVVAAWVEDLIDARDPDAVCIDYLGLGAGICDNLHKDGYSYISVNVSASPSRKERFENLRAELYWELRELFRERKIRIPKNEKLIYELSSIKILKWEPKILLMGKREMRIKGIKSPNIADALMLSLYARSSSLTDSKPKKGGYDFNHKPKTMGWMAA